ncbi:MAG: DUF362 domain-containing protein, partial [Desulfobacterales bacterium]|nr:DUF362 domain-containing protein [Desulfobacterales bacterium]
MSPDPLLNRREFMSRMTRAGAALLAAGGIAALAYDPAGPGPASVEPAASGLPDFSLAEAGRRMCIARGGDRPRTLQLALQALGGIETFIRKGDRVLIKVNAAFASPPLLSATTHPELLSEMIRRCRMAGAAAVRVTDNPINDPASCFALTGIGEAARSAGAELILPEERFFRPFTLKDAALIRNWPVLLEPLSGVTKLIGLAPLKDHHRSGASMVMKAGRHGEAHAGGTRRDHHHDQQRPHRRFAGGPERDAYVDRRHRSGATIARCPRSRWPHEDRNRPPRQPGVFLRGLRMVLRGRHPRKATLAAAGLAGQLAARARSAGRARDA